MLRLLSVLIAGLLVTGALSALFFPAAPPHPGNAPRFPGETAAEDHEQRAGMSAEDLAQRAREYFQDIAWRPADDSDVTVRSTALGWIVTFQAQAASTCPDDVLYRPDLHDLLYRPSLDEVAHAPAGYCRISDLVLRDIDTCMARDGWTVLAHGHRTWFLAGLWPAALSPKDRRCIPANTGTRPVIAAPSRAPQQHTPTTPLVADPSPVGIPSGATNRASDPSFCGHLLP